MADHRSIIADARRRLRHVAVALALIAPSTLPAQISIPLGGPKKERPSPNAALLGAPVDTAAAVAARGRPAAMRILDDAYHPVEVLAYLGLSRGVRVLVVERDLGYFGEIIGAALGPDGRVTELIRPDAMQDPATRAALSDAISLAPSLSLLAAAPDAARLAPDSYDFVLLHRGYDRLSAAAAPEPRRAAVAAFLAKLVAAVRPGGVVGVVEGAGRSDDDRDNSPPVGDAATVKRDFARAGFVLDSEGRPRGGGEASGAGRSPDAVAPGFILKFRKPE